MALTTFEPADLATINTCFQKATGRPIAELTEDTRIDSFIKDELVVIDFITDVEAACSVEFPDFEVTTTATLGQLAALVNWLRKR